MAKKLMILFILGCGLVLLVPPLPQSLSLVSVFRVTKEPVAITRGTYGSALTVNISFGDDEVKEWIQDTRKTISTPVIRPRLGRKISRNDSPHY